MVEKAIESWPSLQIKRSLANLQSLAELPGFLAIAIEKLDGPPADLAAVIDQSPGLCAGLISLARQRGIDPGQLAYSTKQILDRLDPQQLGCWILSIRPYHPLDQGPKIPSRSDLILHSLAVAHCARRLAQVCPDGPAPELAYAAGLLHDIGKLAIQQAMPKGFGHIILQARSLGRPSYLIERQQLGTDHAALGRFLAGLWQLPQVLSDAIWLHHSPSAALGQDKLLARLVAVADTIGRASGVGQSGSFDHAEITGQLAGLVGLDLELLEAIKAYIEGIKKDLAQILIGHEGSWDLLAEATRTKAAVLASLCQRQAQERRQLDATKRQLELTKDLVAAITDASTPWQLGGRLLQLWQHYYQTAKVCVLTLPVGRLGPIQLIVVGELGNGTDMMVDEPAMLELLMRSAMQPFDVYEGQAFAQFLSTHLANQWAGAHTYWVPLTFGQIGLGVLVFELNYPVELNRFVGQLAISTQIVGAALYLMESGLYQQHQAEDLAGLLSDMPAGTISQTGLDLTQALAEVASGLAHELNNPLAVISGRAQLLAGSAHDEQIRKACQQIQQQSQQVAALVEGLMAYAEPTPAHKRATPVGQVLEEAVALARQRLAGQDVDLRVDLPSDTMLLDVDSAQVASALANIIVNAFQSYPDQTGPVQITVHPSAQTAKICVIDQGMGMDQQTITKATLPFFSARPAGRQTGLGLAFADRLISINGGRLYIISQPGQGTTVELELPIATRS